MSDLRDLKKRLKAATGPDRKLDVRLWAEINDRDVRYEGGHLFGKSRKPPFDECMLGAFHPGGGFNASSATPFIPYFTSSIDEAVAFVERVLPGAMVSIYLNGKRAKVRLADINIGDEDTEFNTDWMPNAAIALCLAAIRALIAKGE